LEAARCPQRVILLALEREFGYVLRWGGNAELFAPLLRLQLITEQRKNDRN
jgi:hypothetical protein